MQVGAIHASYQKGYLCSIYFPTNEHQSKSENDQAKQETPRTGLNA